MNDRSFTFNEPGLGFFDLDKVIFKSGCQPRNATDYYYHPDTATFYSYYWGSDEGRWSKNASVDMNDVKPGTIIPFTKNDYDQEILKLKKERKAIDVKIKKIKAKRDQK